MKILPPTSDEGIGHALVVEADSGTREICRAALECLGFSVNTVDSGVAAVTAARETKPDIVLFDLQLRDVGGSELLHWLRGNPALQHVPMIAISVLADPDATAIHKKVAGVLRKPVSRAELKNAVRNLFRAGPRQV